MASGRHLVFGRRPADGGREARILVLHVRTASGQARPVLSEQSPFPAINLFDLEALRLFRSSLLHNVRLNNPLDPTQFQAQAAAVAADAKRSSSEWLLKIEPPVWRHATARAINAARSAGKVFVPEYEASPGLSGGDGLRVDLTSDGFRLELVDQADGPGGFRPRTLYTLTLSPKLRDVYGQVC